MEAEDEVMGKGETKKLLLGPAEMAAVAQRQFEEAAEVLQLFRSDVRQFAYVAEMGYRMASILQSGGKLLACGNGGSACDAMHFAEELSGRFREDRPGLAAMALTDAAHMSCVGNDYGFEHVFARYVEAVGRAEDGLLLISTSGRAANVCAALKVAKKRGLESFVLTGGDGGALAASGADVVICVPHDGYSDRIQEIHIKVIHALIHLIESALFR